ncbi:hypothetical protein ACK3OH_004531 [Salmonella enterica]
MKAQTKIKQKPYTTKVITLGVLQFVIYMVCFCTGYYLLYSNLSDKSFRVLIAIAAMVAIYTSLHPWMAIDEIRSTNERLGIQSDEYLAYLPMIIPFVLFVVCYFAFSFFEWAFPVSKEVVIYFCVLYCVCNPVCVALTQNITNFYK